MRVSAWHNLHLRKLPQLPGLVLRVEFLKADDTPRYKTPMYLFWTGPLTVSLEQLCRMYLWRFAIEHAFRFLKQPLVSTQRNQPIPRLSAIGNGWWPWLIGN